jgi:hypothetical protein
MYYAHSVYYTWSEKSVPKGCGWIFVPEIACNNFISLHQYTHTPPEGNAFALHNLEVYVKASSNICNSMVYRLILKRLCWTPSCNKGLQSHHYNLLHDLFLAHVHFFREDIEISTFFVCLRPSFSTSEPAHRYSWNLVWTSYHCKPRHQVIIYICL